MTETTASSRVTQENGTRLNNGTDAGASTGNGGAPDGGGPDGNGHGGNGRPGGNGGRYTEADLEPIRARLAALARGDFRPRATRPRSFPRPARCWPRSSISLTRSAAS